ncbi:MAG: hypothetical protein Q8M16_12630 [Pirellulaceae bacterium]|nr:hypothetical protein [Pirellulaceae bacterium]
MSPCKFYGAWLLVLLIGISALGCRDSKPTEVPTTGPTMTEAELEALRLAPLKVLLVGSPAWSEEIKLQFEGRGGATIAITTIDAEQWANTTNEDCDAYDVLMVPPDRLAPLVAADKLLKFPPAILEKWGHNSWFAVDRRIGRIDQNTYGISLGTPLAAVLVHPNAGGADSNELRIPENWAEWQAAADSDRQNQRPLRWVEPMSGFNPASSLMLRAASMAKSQSQSDVFYSRVDGEPRLTSPPFVKAMEDLKATYGPNAAELKNLSAPDLIAQVQAGTVQGALVPLPRLDDVSVGVANLKPTPPPGSQRFYNFFDKSWTNRSAGVLRTQVVGVSGHIVCVLRRTRKSEAAFKLVELMVTTPTAETFAPFAEQVLVSRSEQWSNASQWIGRQYSVDATDKIRNIFDLANDDVLGGTEIFPSLPGNRERLQALTEAVWHVLEDRKEPRAALEECQQIWIEIGKNHSPLDPLTIFQRSK